MYFFCLLFYILLVSFSWYACCFCPVLPCLVNWSPGWKLLCLLCDVTPEWTVGSFDDNFRTCQSLFFFPRTRTYTTSKDPLTWGIRNGAECVIFSHMRTRNEFEACTNAYAIGMDFPGKLHGRGCRWGSLSVQFWPPRTLSWFCKGFM